jgi:hypothetical protein
VDSFDLRSHISDLPDLPRADGRGFCMAACDRGRYPEGDGCRRGAHCVGVPQRSQSFRITEVCVPGDATPAPQEEP